MDKRLLAVLVVLGGWPAPVRAATIQVPADYPTIWEAVDAAVSGDSVMVAAGTWTDTDTRVVSIGGSLRTFTSAAFSGAGFVTTLIFANDPGEVVLEGLSITGAAAGASGIFGDFSGRLIVRNCHVSGNDHPGCLGGIVVDTCDLLLEDSEVSFNFGVQATAGVDADFCEVQAYRTRGRHCRRGLRVYREPHVGVRCCLHHLGPGERTGSRKSVSEEREHGSRGRRSLG